MTLRGFLDAGYALLLEDALRIPGVLLEQAMEMVDNSFKAVGTEPAIESGVSVAAQNESAMAQLRIRMQGVKK